MFAHKKIAFFDAHPYDIQSFSEENKNFGFDISYFDTRLQLQTAPLARHHPIACLFVHDRVSEPVADALYHGGVRLLALRSNGYNHIDMSAVKDRFHVVRVPRYSPHAVAEFTIGLILSLNRKIHLAYWRTKHNNFSLINPMGFDIYDKVAGVIGTGQIGSLVCRFLKGFGMRVLAYATHHSEALIKDNIVEYVDLPHLFKESDIVTLHCPLVPSTAHIISKESLEQMKKGAILINTSRGGLVHSQALIEAIKKGTLGGAALDVYEEEEEFFYQDFSDSCIQDDVLARLLSFPNVMVTAHQAFFTKEAMRDIAQMTLNNIATFCRGEPLINQVV